MNRAYCSIESQFFFILHSAKDNDTYRITFCKHVYNTFLRNVFNMTGHVRGVCVLFESRLFRSTQSKLKICEIIILTFKFTIKIHPWCCKTTLLYRNKKVTFSYSSPTNLFFLFKKMQPLTATITADCLIFSYNSSTIDIQLINRYSTD